LAPAVAPNPGKFAMQWSASSAPSQFLISSVIALASAKKPFATFFSRCVSRGWWSCVVVAAEPDGGNQGLIDKIPAEIYYVK